MTKVTHQSEIEKFDLKEKTIELHYGNPLDKENSIYTVSRQGFESWLRAEKKLECNIYTATEAINTPFTIEEYWKDVEHSVKYSDLKEFMILIERRELAASTKMTEQSLAESVAAVTNNEFASQVMECVQHIKETYARFHMLEPMPVFKKNPHPTHGELAS